MGPRYDYKDFREKPSEILEKGQNNEMVLIKGIPRGINTKNSNEENTEIVEGILELGKGNFMNFYGKNLKGHHHLIDSITYLKASSESNQEIELSGIYNQIGNELLIESVKLGNLEKRFLNTKMNCSGVPPAK